MQMLLKTLSSKEGLNRKYFIIHVIMVVGFVCISGIFAGFLDSINSDVTIFLEKIFKPIVISVFLVYFLAIYIQRLRGLSLPFISAGILVIPAVNILFVIYLFTKKDNKNFSYFNEAQDTGMSDSKDSRFRR